MAAESSNHKLISFPHLSDAEFDEACSALLKRFELHGHRQTDWIALHVESRYDVRYLSITKALTPQLDTSDVSGETGETELIEEDDEVAETAAYTQPDIRYDIVLSPTYRVPVLYFFISDVQHRYPVTVDTLYNHVIPPCFRAETQKVGVMGGVTITDHPVTNRPVFFIHPCQTSEVMEASVSGQDISPYEYLLTWLGAMGKCVGLNVPLALVE